MGQKVPLASVRLLTTLSGERVSKTERFRHATTMKTKTKGNKKKRDNKRLVIVLVEVSSEWGEASIDEELGIAELPVGEDVVEEVGGIPEKLLAFLARHEEIDELATVGLVPEGLDDDGHFVVRACLLSVRCGFCCCWRCGRRPGRRERRRERDGKVAGKKTKTNAAERNERQERTRGQTPKQRAEGRKRKEDGRETDARSDNTSLKPS